MAAAVNSQGAREGESGRKWATAPAAQAHSPASLSESTVPSPPPTPPGHPQPPEAGAEQGGLRLGIAKAAWTRHMQSEW